MKIMIGFVNQFYTPQLNIGLLNLADSDFRWVTNERIEAATAHVHGVNGMLKVGDRLLIGYQSEPTTLAVFDHDFKLIHQKNCHDIAQLHSLCHFGSNALCISTGTEETHLIDLANMSDSLHTSQWRRMGKQSGRFDRNHFNSVASCEGRVMATCFGPKLHGNWVHSKNGQIVNLISGEVEKQNLHQPHSLKFHRGSWLVCESGTGRILGERGELIEVGGYVRGLAPISDDLICVASSAQRIQSRSKGTINLGLDKSQGQQKTAIHIVDLKTEKTIQSVDLSIHGAEIFDLIPMPDYQQPEWIGLLDPLEIQVSHLERQLKTQKKSNLIKNRFTRALRAFIKRY